MWKDPLEMTCDMMGIVMQCYNDDPIFRGQCGINLWKDADVTSCDPQQVMEMLQEWLDIVMAASPV